jgi:phosphate transport system permease protein
MTRTTEPQVQDHPTPDAARRARSSRKPSARTATVFEIAAAIVVAIGAVLLARAAFDVSNAAVLFVVFYLVFVAVVALIEFATASSTGPPVHIDLVQEANSDDTERAVAAPIVALQVAPEPEAEPTDPADDRPVKRQKVTAADLVEAGVALLAATAVAEFLRIVLHMRSVVGFAIWWYVAFVAVYYLLTRDRHDPETAVDRIITLLVWSGAAIIVFVLGWMLATVVSKGLEKLDWGFFTSDLSKTGPLNPGGGAKHAIIGTLEQVGIAAIVVIPLGILTAVYLHEVRGRMTKPIRFIVDAMSGLPSIVAGLLVYTLWVIEHGYSGMAGAAALIVLMLPTMTRTVEEVLRTVPDSLREGASALGAPQWRIVWRVVLPTAVAGIVTAALLAVARGVGETAPMLLTAFGADATNTNPTKGPQSDLPLFVWKLIFVPNKTQQARAWTGLLILVGIVLVFFVSARLVARRGSRKLGGT